MKRKVLLAGGQIEDTTFDDSIINIDLNGKLTWESSSRGRVNDDEVRQIIENWIFNDGGKAHLVVTFEVQGGNKSEYKLQFTKNSYVTITNTMMMLQTTEISTICGSYLVNLTITKNSSVSISINSINVT